MHMDNFSHVGSSHKEFDHRAPSAVDPLMNGTLQSGISTQPTMLMQNGAGPLMMTSGPASVIGAPGNVMGVPMGAPGSVIGAPASVIGAPTMGTHVLSHMPMGLPPGTPSNSRVVMSTGMPVDITTRELDGVPGGSPIGICESTCVPIVGAPITLAGAPITLPGAPMGTPMTFPGAPITLAGPLVIIKGPAPFCISIVGCVLIPLCSVPFISGSTAEGAR